MMQKWKEEDLQRRKEGSAKKSPTPACASHPASVRLSKSEFEEVTAIWTESKPPEPEHEGNSGRHYWCDYHGSCPCEFHRRQTLKAQNHAPPSPQKCTQVRVTHEFVTNLEVPAKYHSTKNRWEHGLVTVGHTKGAPLLWQERRKVRNPNSGPWRSFGSTQLALTGSQSTLCLGQALNLKSTHEGSFMARRPEVKRTSNGNGKSLVDYFSSSWSSSGSGSNANGMLRADPHGK